NVQEGRGPEGHTAFFASQVARHGSFVWKFHVLLLLYSLIIKTRAPHRSYFDYI
ncbi:hypothetical protein NDU88_003071, partial [Pleurodeles waltl]